MHINVYNCYVSFLDPCLNFEGVYYDENSTFINITRNLETFTVFYLESKTSISGEFTSKTECTGNLNLQDNLAITFNVTECKMFWDNGGVQHIWTKYMCNNTKGE